MLCDNTLQLIFKDIFSLVSSYYLFWCEPLFIYFCGGLLVSSVHLLCSWFPIELHPHYHSKVIHLRSLYGFRCIFQDKSTNLCFPPLSPSPNRRSVVNISCRDDPQTDGSITPADHLMNRRWNSQISCKQMPICCIKCTLVS